MKLVKKKLKTLIGLLDRVQDELYDKVKNQIWDKISHRFGVEYPRQISNFILEQEKDQT